MKHIFALFITLMLLAPIAGMGQDAALGKWVTIDDDTNEKKSVVEIYERDGKVYGKIIKLFRGPDEDPDPVCDDCDEDDPRFMKKVIGMEILTDMVKEEDGDYEDGEILDPKNGKVYSCRIWIENEDLKVRGYWGFLYRTQTWYKYKN
ncbi:MAG: DUF2147 domain-containing protein [Cyclobacteriaceae bacterium]|nr:DUF2147 domain-containing protein [Cyclobacteriaceae bacterium]